MTNSTRNALVPNLDSDAPAVAAVWADFISNVQFSDLPPAVIHQMKRSLLDMLGVAVIGSRHHSTRMLVSYLKRNGGTAEATVIPSGWRTSGFNAALALGTSVHAPELAESFTRGTMHVGNAVAPPAFVQAERRSSTGRDLITAMAAGYEIAIRAGLAVRVKPSSPTFAAKDETRPSSPLGPTGISHPVSTFGIYGATAAAAKLLGLDVAKTAQALTISTSLTPAIGRLGGFWEGVMAKDLFQGMHGAISLMASDLAGEGMTGGDDVTSHFKSLVADYEPSVLLRGIGTEYLITSGGLHFKVHSTAGMTQPAADAVLDAMRKQRVRPADIERIDVEVPARGTRQSANPAPTTDISARVSVPYVVSAVIAFYEDVLRDPYFTELYTSERLVDEARAQLALRVKVIGSEDLEKGFDREWPMRFGSNVTIHLKSGSVLKGSAEIWSTSSNLTDQQVIDKFNDVAGRVLGPDRVGVVAEKVFELDDAVTVHEIVRALCL